MSGTSGEYVLEFIEQNGDWLTFSLLGDLPIQDDDTMELVSIASGETIPYSTFNHFRKIGEVKA